MALRNHLHVRDWLRLHPYAAAAYGALKKGLAARFRDDIDGYVEERQTPAGDLARGRFSHLNLVVIAAANTSRPGAPR